MNIYIYIYTYIHIYMHMCINLNKNCYYEYELNYINTHTYVRTYVHTYTHTCSYHTVFIYWLDVASRSDMFLSYCLHLLIGCCFTFRHVPIILSSSTDWMLLHVQICSYHTVFIYWLDVASRSDMFLSYCLHLLIGCCFTFRHVPIILSSSTDWMLLHVQTCSYHTVFIYWLDVASRSDMFLSYCLHLLIGSSTFTDSVIRDHTVFIYCHCRHQLLHVQTCSYHTVFIYWLDVASRSDMFLSYCLHLLIGCCFTFRHVPIILSSSTDWMLLHVQICSYHTVFIYWLDVASRSDMLLSYCLHLLIGCCFTFRHVPIILSSSTDWMLLHVQTCSYHTVFIYWLDVASRSDMLLSYCLHLLIGCCFTFRYVPIILSSSTDWMLLHVQICSYHTVFIYWLDVASRSDMFLSYSLHLLTYIFENNPGFEHLILQLSETAKTWWCINMFIYIHSYASVNW